jgi:hypothetical protein
MRSVRKAKGRFLFRDFAPLLSDFSKIWYGAQITTTCHSRVVRDLRAEPAVSRSLPSLPSLRELSCSIAAAQFPECCVSLVSGFPCGVLSDSLAGLVSDAPPSSVAGSLPNLAPDSHPEVLPQFPCESRFRFPLESLSRHSCEFRFRFSDGSGHSLLLEDHSSVELKDTLDCDEYKGVERLIFCGNMALFVEMRPTWR